MAEDVVADVTDDAVDDVAEARERAEEAAYADCVLCGKPTEYPETVKGATLCPVCEWQEAQRTACSG
ncbi:hypothetical protein CU044_2792 [Streptomyces sp. L-9-10]|uniref:hypothetical protein n=1 Tax=Streptomyces sp. L-9-10 TaxID=1478131 RepID=UPI00101DDB99|nr:hypothetical protein [Streptomyces sp. L-9-10]RYJ28375.1 hypothetical protein CU044_2792 [Streptomyces sp. L-9-10]